ncbi:MAG: DUF2332 domain-containing protein [Acidimicrobiales bacterium]
MREPTSRAALPEQFRRFARAVGRDGALRYAAICEGCATDSWLLDLVAQAPPDQRRPNILLAAVHYLLLGGADHPLASWYPTVGAHGGGAPMPLDGIFPAFASFCRLHRHELGALVATRAIQTNEVGRCTALLPALATVASRSAAPLAVVDLGTSAALNLYFDRYEYRYVHDGAVTVAGAPGSQVSLRCDVVDHVPPTAPFDVATRLGVDKAPVDVRDDASARWILACQWPDHLDRFSIARDAITLARDGTGQDVAIEIREGDMVESLPRVAADVPAHVRLCLVHTWVAAYLPPDAQRALAVQVAAIAATRPVSWVFAEAPYEVPGLPMPPSPPGADRSATALVLVEDGPDTPRREWRLADMHSHGRWLRWFGTADPAGGT